MIAGLDVVTFGEVMAAFLATEPGPLDHVDTYVRALAGAEVNVATGLARLGHRVGWVGRVGDDPFGRYALAELAAAGVDTSAVTLDADAPTAFQLKSRADGGEPQVVYFRRDSAGSRLASSPATDAYLAGSRHLHVTGIPPALSASTRSFTIRAIDVARTAGAIVSFDPNLRPVLWHDRAEMVAVVNELAARADWVLPGVTEGAVLTGSTDPACIASFYLDRGVSVVVVKNGAAGADLYTADGRHWHQPAFPVAVVDPVGAGDGFAAGFISGGLDGLPLDECLRRAAAVGALATTHPGDRDGLPDRDRLSRFLTPATT